jgi:hypothetical protein
LVFDYPTAEALAGFLAQELPFAEADLVASQAEMPSMNQKSAAAEALTELEQISDEEAEALLLAELKNTDKGS